MAIELVDNSEGDLLGAAFDLIEREIKAGRKFGNREKDLGVLISIDSLAPTERPWFFEVGQMLKIPLWQTLWGQWRRCQENGLAQAPILDPGWEGELTGEYGLEERTCNECHQLFKPERHGQMFCNNVCGVAGERRRIAAIPVAPVLDISDDQFGRLHDARTAFHVTDDSESLDLGTEVIEVIEVD